VYINGEAVRVAGKDAALLRRLADERALDAGAVGRASGAVRSLLADWFAAGWLDSPRRARLEGGLLRMAKPLPKARKKR
jgi:50S ribosomal protein L16 3-hydroxylase